MRKSIILFAAVAAFGLIAESASAKLISFTATVSQVRAGCSKAGGTFSVHQDGGGYGCTKANCDGKGGDCTVSCDNNNNCHGGTPNPKRTGGSLVDIIRGLAGATTDSPAKPGKTGGLLGDGILGTGPGFATTGPSATGSPAATGGGAAPPASPGAAGGGTIR